MQMQLRRAKQEAKAAAEFFALLSTVGIGDDGESKTTATTKANAFGRLAG
jgi:hypothetical protein